MPPWQSPREGRFLQVYSFRASLEKYLYDKLAKSPRIAISVAEFLQFVAFLAVLGRL
jgi:hypothetical protein